MVIFGYAVNRAYGDDGDDARALAGARFLERAFRS
jgi:hypothetical protein